MGTIHIEKFAGRAPRVSPALLPPSYAQVASNTNLYSGELRPWADPLTVDSPAKDGVLRAIFRYQSTYWLHWTEDVDVVRSPIAGDSRVFFTGTDAPRFTDAALIIAGGGAEYPTSSYLLGVPPPNNAPVGALGDGGAGDPRARNYVYTFVSGFNEEGPMSLPSATISPRPGQSVTLSGFEAPPAGHNIRRIRIYRVNTGSVDEAYQYLDEIPVEQAAYVDTKADTDLNEVLRSATFYPPPVDMKGIIALPNGVVAGFAGNTLYVSEPYRPHAYPPDYQHSFPDEIVAIGSFGTTIVVTTKGVQWSVSGQHPSVYTPTKGTTPYANVSRRSLIGVPGGVQYASTDGIVYVGAGGERLVTEGILTSQEWKAFKPETIRASLIDGRYCGFYQTGTVNGVEQGGGFILHREGDRAFLADIGFYASAIYREDSDGELYVARAVDGKNVIQQWAGGGGRLSYAWRSSQFDVVYPQNMAVARIKGDFTTTAEQTAYDQCLIDQAADIASNDAIIATGDLGGALCEAGVCEYGLADDKRNLIRTCVGFAKSLTFKLYGDGIEKHSVAVTSDKPFRLPPGYRAGVYEVQLEGNVYVKQVTVATSMEELSRHG